MYFTDSRRPNDSKPALADLERRMARDAAMGKMRATARRATSKADQWRYYTPATTCMRHLHGDWKIRLPSALVWRRVRRRSCDANVTSGREPGNAKRQPARRRHGTTRRSECCRGNVGHRWRL